MQIRHYDIMMAVMSPLAREVDDTIRALDADTASKLEAVLKDAMELAKHVFAMSMAEDDPAAITIRHAGNTAADFAR